MLHIIIIAGLAITVTVLSIVVIKVFISPKRLSAIPNLIKQGKYSSAEKALKSILTKDGRNTTARYYLSQCYLAQGKGELALMELKTIGELSLFNNVLPENMFRKLIAELYERFGHIEEALKEYILLVKNEPENAEYYYHCARIFNERNKLDVAAKYARKAVDIDPKNAKAHYIFGLILYKMKNSTDAKTELETAVKLDPTNYDAFFYLGKLLKDMNIYTAAIEAFDKAQKNPELKLKALIEKGATYMNQASYENAIVELDRAVKSAKDDGATEALYARYFLAICYEKLKNIDSAIEQWEKINAKKSQFKDVAEKLKQYQEYRTDDHLKDFLTCGYTDFVELCKSIVNKVLLLTIRDVVESKNGVDFIAVENDSDKWMGVKKMPKLLRFMRVSDILDDSSVRNLLDNMKRMHIMRGAIITSSGFTRTAMEFAENRAVDLYNKDQLQAFLKKAVK